jgi:AraC family transcriptional regulator
VLAPPLSTAVGYLQREWSEMPLRRIGVAELASAVSVSRSYLRRLFRSGFGLGAAAALEQARCARAETLLTRTDLSVEAVAYQCGFADLSHFSHRFTAIYGVPPSVYRSGSQTPSVLDHPGVRHLTHLLWG